MITFLNVFSSELLKLKRTLALWLVVLAPLVVLVIELLLFLNLSERFVSDEFDPWLFLLRNNYAIWVLLMLTMFIALETALINGVEHRSHGWKMLLAFPVPRWQIYIAKLLIALILNLLALSVLGAGVILTGILIQGVGLKPEVNWNTGIPWRELFSTGILIFVTSILILTIHHWISTRWSGFVLALGIGIAMTLAGFFAANSGLAIRYFPWSLPFNALAPITPDLTGDIPNAIWLNTIGAILIGLLGAVDISRRDVL